MKTAERVLDERFDAVAARLPDRVAALDALATLIRSGEDHEVVRVNPIRDVVDGYALSADSVELKGIHGPVRTHRLRPATPVE